MTAGIALVGGALVGSAAGAALHRWPQGETLLRPARSRCPACLQVLRARDLVPVVSWVIRRGRCAACAAPIDPRFLVLEAGSALLAAGVVAVHGVGAQAVLLAVGAVAVLLAALADIERMRIPDRLTVPLAVLAIVGVVSTASGEVPPGLLLGWSIGVPALLALLSAGSVRIGLPRPVGCGDIKLLVGALALTSLVPGGPAAMLAFAVVGAGSIAALGLMTGVVRRGDRVPFAPAIGAGYLGVVLAPSLATTVAGWSIAVPAGPS